VTPPGVLESKSEAGAAAPVRELGNGRYGWIVGGALLAILGGAAASVPIAAIGLVLAGLGLLRWVTVDRGLRGLVVSRSLERDQVICGDRVEVVLTVRNRDPLPVPWLLVAEALPAALDLRLVEEGPASGPGVAEQPAPWELRNAWSLAPYRRATRRLSVVAGHRGVHRFDLVQVSAGDMLGRTIGHEERSMPATLIVRPRLVATDALDARHDWNGERPTRTGRIDDPSRFAGVRPYAPGDPVRRLHWRATVRLGQPVVKRFDPARERDVIVVLDIDTRTGEGDQPAERDRLEELCIVAASLARRFEREGAACGLAAAAFSGGGRRMGYLAPSRATGQSGRIGDFLARLNAFPAGPFPVLLAAMAQVARPGTQLVVVSARDPRPCLATARQLRRSGFAVELVLLGPQSVDHAGLVRRLGISARAVRLDAHWRTSRALELVG
jgi:uncharacterized protein (DUF58 family)